MHEEYRKALRRGRRSRRDALARSQSPYLPALDGMLDAAETAGTVRLGVMDVPLDMVVGTRTAGRRDAFACDFMPLLEPDTEFAFKWGLLYDVQVEEGFRDPVVVFEYLHRFYVQEGNKRVSVLKYVGAATATADVTRILPSAWDGPESRLYGEFLEFWDAVPLYDVRLTREGGYRRLAKAFGHDLSAPWDEREVLRLKGAYQRFKSVYLDLGGGHLDITPGDAMLVYLDLYPDERIMDTPTAIVRGRLRRIWQELALDGRDDGVLLVHDPVPGRTTPRSVGLSLRRTPYSATRPLRVAFVYRDNVSDSPWARAHDLGRLEVERRFGGIVRTRPYESCGTEALLSEGIEEALDDGADVVFTTSPGQMPGTARAAARHRDALFLNCSVNLPHSLVRSYHARTYEATFVMGAVAAQLAGGGPIGCLSAQPTYGTLAAVNAFAIGAAMVDPRVRVLLRWRRGDVRRIMEGLAEEGVTVFSTDDARGPQGVRGGYGVYRLEDGRPVGDPAGASGGAGGALAAPFVDWGAYYALIVESLLSGSWHDLPGGGVPRAVNYWYGMSAGVVDVCLWEGLPYYTRKMAAALRRGVSEGTIGPFDGELRAQGGRQVRPAGSPRLPDGEVVAMGWLNDNVDGSLDDSALGAGR